MVDFYVLGFRWTCYFTECERVCVCSGSVSGGEEEEGPGVADFNRTNQELGGG